MEIRPNDALIVVDVQKDFCLGGSLAVKDGDKVVPIINRLQPHFEHAYFTRDWHPADHCSFKENAEFVDGSWPPHCIQNTPGAEFHEELDVPADANVVSTGTESDKEAYSGFQGTNLADRLHRAGVERVFVAGLATDYCVKHTALDARKNGFDTLLIRDAIRGVDNPPGTAQEALDEMREAGVKFVESEEILQ